jgi:hypothetical protein
MKRLNLTLVVEEDLLREARAVAARRRTSVNEMVRGFLRDVVNQESRRLTALADSAAPGPPSGDAFTDRVHVVP